MNEERTDKLQETFGQEAAEKIRERQKARQNAMDELGSSIIAFIKAWDDETEAFEDILGDIVIGRKIYSKTFYSSIDFLEYIVRRLKEQEEDAE